ncbi:MAG: sensor histidine kinase [Marinifilaceae bacterium]
MRKQQIIVLCVVLGLSLVGLICIQASYFQTAFQLKKAQFDYTVNQSIDEVIAYLDHLDRERQRVSLAEEQFPSVADNNLVGGNDDLNSVWQDKINLLVEYELNDEGKSIENAKQDLFSNAKTNNLKHSISKSRQALREKIGHQYDVVINVVDKRAVLSLKDRLEGVQIERFLKDAFKNNGINEQFEYAVKEHQSFVMSSANFFNRYSEYNYCKAIYMGETQKLGSFHVNFPHMSDDAWASILLLSPSLIITLILVLCFGFCIVVIIRQKKLSVIKNDFINNMTHEFKTPIATISLASQMLKDGALNHSTESVERIAGIIRDESKRLTFQVEKVLQTALFTESRMKLKYKKVNLNDVVENMVNKFALRIEDKKGLITAHFDATFDEVYVDEVHIANVFSNLLDNAIKYCAKSPEISVYTRNKKDEIIVSVIDNGIGIAANDQKMIFERFYRVSTGNLHDVKGFGLGLSYVKTIVESHGGRIAVESVEGKGSRFDIILPLMNKKLKVKRTLFF